MPVLRSTITLQLPPGWHARTTTFNHTPIEPVLSGSRYRWELLNLPYIKNEPASPHLDRLAPRLGVSYFPPSGSDRTHGRSFDSWEEVSSWLADLNDPSSPTSGGACIGTGIPPTKIDSVVGIVKAYTTRVGNGPFPTELLDAEGEKLRTIGAEFGATTGRPRRCGWYDAFLVAYSQMVNGITSVAITKLDVLSSFEKIKVCVAYELNGKRIKYFPTSVEQLSAVKPSYEVLDGWNEDISNCLSYDQLPAKTKVYLKFIAKHYVIKIDIISVGPKRGQTFYIEK